MSGFFGSTDGTRWGGLLKQAISNVETTFDSLREQNDTSLKQGHYDSDTMETETFIDPMTGAVTTMQRPKRPPIKNTTSMTLEKKTTARPPTTRSASSLPGSPSSDISARLAAVLQEKAATAHSPPSLPTMPEVSSLSVLPPSPALIQQETSETDLRLSSVKKSVSQDTSSTLTDTANVTDATTAATTTDATTTDVEDTTDTAVAKAVADTAVAEVISPTSPPSSSTSLEGGKILEQREKQLLQAMETIASLHDQLHQAQHSQETTQTLLNQVQVQLKAAQHSSPLTSSSSSSSLINKFTKKLESTIEELKQQMALKEEQVQGLLREGEKLSKNEFKHTTTIKKLRSEKIEVDKTVAEIQKKHEKSLLDLQEANAKITKTVEVEKRLQESIKVLSDMTEQQTKHINRLESEALLSKEQHTKTQATLDITLQGLEEERAKVKADSEQVHAATLEKEIKANDRLYKELSKTKEEALTMETQLKKEIRDLQIALQSQEQQLGDREESLRQEIHESRQRLQYVEAKMEAMGDGVEEANATLLQQVEDLKLQCAMANKNRDQAEQNAILKLKAAQIDRQEDLEKLQEANALFSTTNERLQKIQNELSEERKEKEALSSQVEQHKTTTLTLKHQIEQLNQQCIENEVQAEKSAESVKKQYQKLLREKIQEEKRQWEISTMADRSQPLKSFAGYSSLGKEMNKTNEEADAKQMENGHEDKGKDRKPSPPRRRESASPAMSARSSLDGSYIGVSGHYPIASTIRVERLEATTRQLENQISFYQTQLQSTQQSRDELSEEMLTMSLELDKLRKETKRTQDIEQQYQVLNQRYQASLEMLGERTEQVEELKADLDDVKEMYKLQTIELVQKIDQLSKK